MRATTRKLCCDWKILQHLLLDISLCFPLCQHYREKRGLKVIALALWHHFSQCIYGAGGKKTAQCLQMAASLHCFFSAITVITNSRKNKIRNIFFLWCFIHHNIYTPKNTINFYFFFINYESITSSCFSSFLKAKCLCLQLRDSQYKLWCSKVRNNTSCH